ncbi:MAG: L-ascorbate metabolism protein UlaG (beta-lactamase superfamily) [Halieaceae bacterium]|jgi:L-ascorbate metabolism protein UlaG (beta-lactamase superfamily)
MGILKKIGVILLALTLLAAIFFTYLWNARDSLEPFEQLVVEPSPIPSGEVYVQYLGNTNILISDGQTALLIDGWFSRPSFIAMAFSPIEPDREAIAQSLARAGISKLAAVIPGHSHYDHAMDAPLVAAATGAELIGSESTLNIGRGLELPEQQMRLVTPGEPMEYGEFVITLMETRHYRFPRAGINEAAMSSPLIEEPLVPPASAFEYKEGGSYSIHIRHPQGSVLIQASAGFKADALNGLQADVLFLGIGGIAAQTAEYQEQYWQEIVTPLAPKRLVPVHWDSMTDALADEPVMPTLFTSMLWDYLSSDDLTYSRNRAADAGIEMVLLPMWTPVALFP